MNVFIKSIRKLMGWCPNAKPIETGSGISSDNFEMHDQSGTERTKGDLNHMQKIGFLLASIGGFLSALSLALNLKNNISSFMVGAGELLVLVGIIIYIRN